MENIELIYWTKWLCVATFTLAITTFLLVVASLVCGFCAYRAAKDLEKSTTKVVTDLFYAVHDLKAQMINIAQSFYNKITK